MQLGDNGEKRESVLTESKEQQRDPEKRPQPEGVTELLQEWTKGDRDALDKVLPLVYEELRMLARSHFKESTGSDIPQATELVGMVYLRLRDRKNIRFRSRNHFFWYASQMIRRILVDHLRSRLTQKRGGGVILSLDKEVEGVNLQKADAATLIALDEALTRLETLHPKQCRIIEMQNFAGMTILEIAEIMAMSQATVKREASAAKRWLFFELSRK